MIYHQCLKNGEMILKAYIILNQKMLVSMTHFITFIIYKKN